MSAFYVLPESSLLYDTAVNQALIVRPRVFREVFEVIYRYSDPVDFASAAAPDLVTKLLASNFVPSFFELGKLEANVWLFCFMYFIEQKGSTAH